MRKEQKVMTQTVVKLYGLFDFPHGPIPQSSNYSEVTFCSSFLNFKAIHILKAFEKQTCSLGKRIIFELSIRLF
jgi:hypothetical protein